MLDSGLPETERAKLAQEARKQIEAGGTLKDENNWGLRKMAYEIRQRTEADYRWFRFEAPTELLGSLDHNLKIADGVLRFRIFKVDPEAPSIVPPAAGAPAAAPSREPEPSPELSPPPVPAAAPSPTAPAAPAEPAAAPAPAEPAAPAATGDEAPSAPAD